MKRRTHEEEAELYDADPELEVAMRVARELGQPLLITGDPGTGKTQAAYYAAWKWNLGKVIHFQVRSDTVAQHLLYDFDAVGYFHAAYMAQFEAGPGPKKRGATGGVGGGGLEKKKFIRERKLWQAFREGEEAGSPRVLLIDEIDKAPKDFPNDLLDTLDQGRFWIREEDEREVTVNPEYRPVIFVTSNSERRLPEPFLRRCVYHHIEFSCEVLEKILKKRGEVDFPNLSEDVVATALRCFIELRNRGGRPLPSTAEFLCWLRMLAADAKEDESVIRRVTEQCWEDFPFKGLLIKDAVRQREMRETSRRR